MRTDFLRTSRPAEVTHPPGAGPICLHVVIRRFFLGLADAPIPARHPSSVFRATSAPLLALHNDETRPCLSGRRLDLSGLGGEAVERGPEAVGIGVGSVGRREITPMTTMRWFRAGATPRGTPAFRRSLRRHPVLLLALAVAALSQTGCVSGPFGCGTCGLGRGVRATSELVTRPIRNAFRPIAAASCCGGSGAIGVESAPITYGSPTVVSPSTIGTPVGAPLPAPTDSFPSNLEAIPSATPGPPPSGSGPAGEASPAQGAKPSTSKTNYEAFRLKSGQGQSRPGALARSAAPSPEPTKRSARGTKPAPAPAPAAAELSDPLDNLPPIELPADLTRNHLTPPAPSSPAKPLAREAAAPGSLSPLASKAAEALAPGADIAPGIHRFGGVESKLAGGSLPDSSGLDWLVEMGYKTVLDLREDSDLSPTFVADVARRGLRYVALPISLKTVDQEHVSRFQFEISLADARPLFFCDADGTRAGVMWYIRRVMLDKVDPLIARRDAEELGLNDTKFWRAAESYLDLWNASQAPAPKPASVPEPKTRDPAPAPAPGPKADANAPAPPSAGPSPTALLGQEERPASEPRDLGEWKPFAAMVVTGLGVPLAYIGRVAFSFKPNSRASLPEPRRSPKALPSSSDG